MRWRRIWQPTPVLLPGESHGRRSLLGYSPWGRKESDTTEQLHFQEMCIKKKHNWETIVELLKHPEISLKMLIFSSQSWKIAQENHRRPRSLEGGVQGDCWDQSQETRQREGSIQGHITFSQTTVWNLTSCQERDRTGLGFLWTWICVLHLIYQASFLSGLTHKCYFLRSWCWVGMFFFIKKKKMGWRRMNWESSIYTTICKIDIWWAAAVQHRELSSVLCDGRAGWDGRGRLKRERM